MTDSRGIHPHQSTRTPHHRLPSRRCCTTITTAYPTHATTTSGSNNQIGISSITLIAHTPKQHDRLPATPHQNRYPTAQTPPKRPPARSDQPTARTGPGAPPTHAYPPPNPANPGATRPATTQDAAPLTHSSPHPHDQPPHNNHHHHNHHHTPPPTTHPTTAPPTAATTRPTTVNT